MENEKGRRNGSSYSIASSSNTTATSTTTMMTHSSSVLLEGVMWKTGREEEVMAAVEKTPLSNGKSGNIVHRVSKMDTLAGIAIKYGVEVADIKRMNGLVSDVQMFAHEKLQIPLPGRHLPSPFLLNGGSSSDRELTPQNRCRQSSVLESLHTLKLKTSDRPTSSAMSILQGYYGLTPSQNGPPAEKNIELDYNRTSRTLNFEEKLLPRASELLQQKSRTIFDKSSPGIIELQSLGSAVGEFTDGNNIINSDKGEVDASSSENSVRRRQKTDADYITLGDNSSGKSIKGLALRGKSASRTDLDSFHHVNPIIIRDSFMADGFISVRKSSSTSNLQDSDNSSSLPWPTTKRNLKNDTIIGRSIFDGLPKPPTSRRNKTALD